MYRDTSRINEQKAIARLAWRTLKELLLSSKLQTQIPAQLFRRPWISSAIPWRCVLAPLGVSCPCTFGCVLLTESPCSLQGQQAQPRSSSGSAFRMGTSANSRLRPARGFHQLLILCWMEFPEWCCRAVPRQAVPSAASSSSALHPDSQRGQGTGKKGIYSSESELTLS